ncbi:MAG: energy transducer TonB [bacterium]
MLKAWNARNPSSVPLTTAGALSVTLHCLVIAVTVVGTKPPAGLPPDGLSNRAIYIPPPNHPPIISGSRESIHFFTLAPGVGIGPGPTVVDASRGVRVPEESPVAGDRAADSVTSAPPAEVVSADSVYTTLEVDTAVVRSASSASPIYPAELIEKRVEGYVLARFIVDTTGFADTASFIVVRSTDARFVRSLHDVLPRMRFSPAKIGPQKVKQLVEQMFSFKITTPAPTVKKDKPD